MKRGRKPRGRLPKHIYDKQRTKEQHTNIRSRFDSLDERKKYIPRCHFERIKESEKIKRHSELFGFKGPVYDYKGSLCNGCLKSDLNKIPSHHAATHCGGGFLCQHCFVFREKVPPSIRKEVDNSGWGEWKYISCLGIALYANKTTEQERKEYPWIKYVINRVKDYGFAFRTMNLVYKCIPQSIRVWKHGDPYPNDFFGFYF